MLAILHNFIGGHKICIIVQDLKSCPRITSALKFAIMFLVTRHFTVALKLTIAQ